ncbi:hypothetical protein ABF87_01220 [Nitrosomonas sp. JL21]|uniref:c-type cytochrome n=1 Tax=Nitrosomonas sp. JL21 TaxID=153949 RepID=UPI0018786D78|nr:c-type cytochrome [Nitrosomonas sp. JL21]MBL8497127.1 c-type cytochrome [Nitrosomonas sp.]MCC7090802.1 c-type cytochrome [Nitrosomonas sp.]MXS76596.1 hypothetical protein [Nitrosomonas sp. JL21]
MIFRHFLKPVAVSAVQILFITPLFAIDDPIDGRGLNPTASTTPTSITGINAHGLDKTYSTAGFIDFDNAFFKKFGTNDRTCATCHVPTEGWVITPKGVKARFDRTAGLDPLFRLVDGATSPRADVSTVEKRRKAYSMLLNKGNIRVGIGIPADAEFELVRADDPYGFASAAELSLFRRPMPATNLKFLSTVMWDGRETTYDAKSKDCLWGTTTCFSPVSYDLSTQANHATLGHAEALADLSQAEREEIVAFEMGLVTAQVRDRTAGSLTNNGALGGSKSLLTQSYYFGMNDTVAGDYRTRAAFNPTAMSLYTAWNKPFNHSRNSQTQARAAIARGEALFNGKPIQISGVKGINDDLGVSVLPGTCTTCHNTPNSGNHSTPMPLDIGVADASRRTPDMPLYTLRHKTTGKTIQTTDPGRALVTGKWKDIGRFKGPVLRAVASRPPYFHDGSAKDLAAVVDFYNKRFTMGLTRQERADLVAFLAAL